MRIEVDTSTEGMIKLLVVHSPATPPPQPCICADVSPVAHFRSSLNASCTLEAPHLFATLHCHPLPSKRSAGTFTRLLSYIKRQNLVFGGLRESSALYLTEGRVPLVNFDRIDWGTRGDRYPIFLDPVVGPGVVVWGIMGSLHDIKNVGRLTNWLSGL